MFQDTVTVFNRRGEMWYPTVLENVKLIVDRASMAARYGAQVNDRAVVLVPLAKNENGDPAAGGKVYVTPKVWAALETPREAVTFASGEEFDFLVAGPWPDDPVQDSDYGVRGFYDYMNRTRDEVYAVTSVSRFETLPHLEITGR